ncbi:MAG: hypothetical protein B7Z09_04665 [Brevundimonas diminuta]|nr:MAG: hypothetical protein B7Z09_04665 [Brevundimonas diminuta]
METIRIENRIGVRATAERLWEVLTDFGGWNRWNPHEIEVEGALGFGAPISLTERLPDLGERQVQAQLGEWEPNAQLVWIERRGFLFRTLRYYEIRTAPAGRTGSSARSAWPEGLRPSSRRRTGAGRGSPWP